MDDIDFNSLDLKDVISIQQIHTGLKTKNYCVKTEKGTFEIKLIDDSEEQRAEKLLENLKSIEKFPFKPDLLWHKKVNHGDAFAFKWINGQHILLDTLTPGQFKEFLSAYMSFVQSVQDNPYILPAFDLQENLDAVHSQYSFVQDDLKDIRDDLRYPPELKIVHGDFHFKNLLFDKGKLKALLDFENFQRGCPTEDLMYLLISNTERRVFFRKRRALKLLKVMMNELPFSKNEWLHGLDVYILKKYVRKLNKKKLSLYKKMTLWRSSHLFKQIRKAIKIHI